MSRIYSATYSNVPVYEFNIAGNHVMRRRSDDWINATHILKVAEYDKPARTRILEREVQRGTHEKVQGGYGKYQGTWIPLPEGRALADKTGCLSKLLPMFEFVPGDRSPPPAPKHASAASSRPKAPRRTAPAASALAPKKRKAPEPPSERYSAQVPEEDSVGDETMSSESEPEMIGNSTYHAGSRKRRRVQDQAEITSREDQQHTAWSDELLDYFMLQKSQERPPSPPDPPPYVDLNKPVDDKGNSAMHWAVAMGDLNVVCDLVRRGANIDVVTGNGETPLMRAVTFTNNWDHQSMGKLMDILYPTVGSRDWFGSTVFHHIAVSTCSKSKYPGAKYYLEAILEKLTEIYPEPQIASLLDQQDHSGDTAILLAAKYGARKCVRALAACGASISVRNQKDETADQFIKELNARRRDRFHHGSSSPVGPETALSSNEPFQSSPQPENGSTQSRVNHYNSEAATIISSQLPSLILSRSEALATALESELADHETQADDRVRLMAQRRQELESLTNDGVTVDAAMEDEDFEEDEEIVELNDLETRAEALMQAEQENAMKTGMKTGAKITAQSTLTDGVNTLGERVHLTSQVSSERDRRGTLTHDLIAAHGLAGFGGERSKAYKRLITAALKIRAEDVESMLPDILEELEESRGEEAASSRHVPLEGAEFGTAPVKVGINLQDEKAMYAGLGGGSGPVGVMG